MFIHWLLLLPLYMGYWWFLGWIKCGPAGPSYIKHPHRKGDFCVGSWFSGVFLSGLSSVLSSSAMILLRKREHCLRGYKTWVQSQTQNKAQWLAACGHMSASSQSLSFILSLRMNSSFLTSKPGCYTSLCSCCQLAVNVLCLFLMPIMVLYIGLWYVVVAFPGHTYLLFVIFIRRVLMNKYKMILVYYQENQKHPLSKNPTHGSSKSCLGLSLWDPIFM